MAYLVNNQPLFDTVKKLVAGSNPDLQDLEDSTIEDALNAIESMVATYTRDRHVTRTGTFKRGIESVIITATARLLANPGQVAVQFSAGSLSVRKGAGFTGFTLGEQMTLDRYRKRGI